MRYIGKFSLCTFGTGILIVGKIDSATECKIKQLIATLSHNSDFFPHNFEFKSHNFYLAEKNLTLFRYKTQSCKMKSLICERKKLKLPFRWKNTSILHTAEYIIY